MFYGEVIFAQQMVRPLLRSFDRDMGRVEARWRYESGSGSYGRCRRSIYLELDRW